MASLVLTGDTSGQVTLAAPAVAGTTTITMPAVTGTMSILPTTPSVVRLNTANGYGSTNTKIRRFTNTVTNQGSDITYADSATLGATFTINTTGIYGVSYSECVSADNAFGVSLNASSFTTNIQSLTASEILCITEQTSANAIGCAAGTYYLSAGNILRPQSMGVAVGTSAAAVQFTIVRIA
jgi:hypothetical protein